MTLEAKVEEHGVMLSGVRWRSQQDYEDALADLVFRGTMITLTDKDGVICRVDPNESYITETELGEGE